MTCAYSELYLDDAMRNLGELTEYAVCAYGQDLEEFFQMFSISGYAVWWEAGDPAVICGISGTELYRRVMEKCGAGQTPWKPALVCFDPDETYWIGYILAYYQWKTACSFSEILHDLSLTDLYRIYPAMHTSSEEHAGEVIAEIIRDHRQTTRLQEYRRRLGLSQRQLAEAAGVNLRTLQQYEIGDKDIRKAGAEKVISIARVLQCDPADLVL